MRKTKRTTDEFKKEIADLVGDEYIVIGEYIKWNEKINFKHNVIGCMFEFAMLPSNFLSGQRCPNCRKKNMLLRAHEKRKTTEQFKKEVFDLVGNEFTVKGEYVNAKTKIAFIHNVSDCMHEFEMWPSNFLSGQRCPACRKKGNIDRIKSTVKTTMQFKEEVFDLVGDEYSIVGEYINSHTKINIKHNVCGQVFQMDPVHFLRGQRCTNETCLHQRMGDNASKVKGNSFERRFEEYADEYDVLSDYKRWNKKMTFKHKLCGCIFERTPNTFFNETNNVHHIKCPDCFKKYWLELTTKTQEQFEKDVFNKYKDEYAILGQYVNSDTKITIKHNKCGFVWNALPSGLLGGTGCPQCKSSKGERKIRLVLENCEINFTPQKTFKGLLGVGKKNLSYDFYLPEYNLLIEYNGQFHDGTADIQTEEWFKTQQEHDRRKREYAKAHGIDLLEIWYWDFDNIESILTEYFNLYNEEAS